MNISLFRRAAFALLLAALANTLTLDTAAQFFPTPGGTTGGSTGGRSGRSGSSSPRDYLNNTQIGDAIISSDPEARKIIIVTDEDTNLHIKEIITNLDRPKPQVLIKVVFVEIQHNKGSDIGLEGGWSKAFTTGTTGTAVNAFGLSDRKSTRLNSSH